MLLRQEGITVVAASVDSVEETDALATGMQIRYVNVLGELDGPAVAEATGARRRGHESHDRRRDRKSVV